MALTFKEQSQLLNDTDFNSPSGFAFDYKVEAKMIQYALYLIKLQDENAVFDNANVYASLMTYCQSIVNMQINRTSYRYVTQMKQLIISESAAEITDYASVETFFSESNIAFKIEAVFKFAAGLTQEIINPT